MQHDVSGQSIPVAITVCLWFSTSPSNDKYSSAATLVVKNCDSFLNSALCLAVSFTLSLGEKLLLWKESRALFLLTLFQKVYGQLMLSKTLIYFFEVNA